MFLNYFKLIVIFLLGALLVVYTNCGKPTALTFENGHYTGPAASYDAFKATVWPITRANCASCHSDIQPQHASEDFSVAHDAAITKVNFINISASRLVAKLRDENHNCWSNCSENAQKMQEAIEAWSRARDQVNSNTPSPTYSIMTEESDVLEMEFADSSNPLKSNTVKIDIDSALLRAPMTRVTNDEGNYLVVPTVSAVTLAANDVNAGIAFMNFVVPVSGQYRLWGLLNGPTANDNAFYANITRNNGGTVTSVSGGPRQWDIPASTAFSWMRHPNINANLVAGTVYTLELRQREDGSRARSFIVTADPDFNGQEVDDFFGITLTYDLSDKVNVPGTLFKIDVIDYDPYSYKFSKPRLVTNGQNFIVKNLKLLVNGQFNPQHSTYTIVDKIADPTDDILSTASMVVIKDQGLAGDKISFTFDELSPTTSNTTGGASGGSSGGNSGQDSVIAYQSTMYPISRSSAYSCVGCHMTVSPRHASSTVQTAHDATLTVVNFNNPADSRIVKKMREERHNCGANCDNIANLYEAAIIEWRSQRP